MCGMFSKNVKVDVLKKCLHISSLPAMLPILLQSVAELALARVMVTVMVMMVMVSLHVGSRKSGAW